MGPSLIILLHHWKNVHSHGSPGKGEHPKYSGFGAQDLRTPDRKPGVDGECQRPG